MLGRWQPFHDGHLALFKEALKKTGQVCIMVRDTGGTDDSNPFDFDFVKEKIESAAGDVVGFQYVDKSSGKSYEQIQNEQGRPTIDFIAGETEAEGNPTVFKTYSAFRGDMPMQQNGVLGSLKNIWKYSFEVFKGI